MYRLKDLPIEESGNSFGAERAHLSQLVLTTLIPQPRFSGKPADGPQHEHSGITSGHKPPIHHRAGSDLQGLTQFPVLLDDATEQGSHLPGKRKAVPSVASPDPIEVGVDAARGTGRKRRSYPDGVDAVSQAVLPGEEFMVELAGLVVECRRESVDEPRRLEAERGVSPRLIFDDHLGHETLDEGVADPAIHRGDEIQPVRREPGCQVWHVDDEAPSQSARQAYAEIISRYDVTSAPPTSYTPGGTSMAAIR